MRSTPIIVSEGEIMLQTNAITTMCLGRNKVIWAIKEKEERKP